MAVRDLILLFDGTWNAAEDEDNNQTNVEKIYRLLPDSCVKCVHYEEGVGTKSGEAILGGVFGAGIDDRILGAYRFLQSKYSEDGFENRLFIFGFSRGAYTARTFAQLLAFSGVPPKGGRTQKGWDCYFRQDEDAAKKLREKNRFLDVSIEVLGLWDTVKSTLDQDRKDRTLYPNVKAAYHAMSIDEKRLTFPVLQFDDDTRIAQVWFAGVHSDVGGGYKAEQAGLADITLAWMVKAAETHGMVFIDDYMDYLAPDPAGDIHNSYSGIWKALGDSTREIGADEKVHVSVKARLGAGVDYHPPNLPSEPCYVG